MMQKMKGGSLGWFNLITSACVLVCSGLIGSLVSDPAAAAAPPSPLEVGKVANGATKAAACAACHGPNGNSTNPEWPRLAGQNAVYIAQQLQLFKSGVRDNAVMKPMAASLSDQDIADLAVYFAAQTPTGLEADPSYWQKGQVLYARGDRDRAIPACTACHGPAGQGTLVSGYPALQAQQAVYVVKQLTDYKNGARYSAHADAVNPNSIIMTQIAQRLTPDDIRNVASFVQGLR